MTAHRAPTGVTRQAVLEYLMREADMDGLVTVSEREVGEVLGITGQAAGSHIRNLADDGQLTLIPGGAGYMAMNAIQLSESVFA